MAGLANVIRAAVAGAIAGATSGRGGDARGKPAPGAAHGGSARRASGRRKQRGSGRTAPLPTTITRWHQRDVEDARHLAGVGNLRMAGQLYRALRGDGVIKGLLGTRCGGLVRLPRRFAGDPAAVAFWEGAQGHPGAFDAVFPASELALLNEDYVVLGVGVAEFVQPDCYRLPVLVRLDPQFLMYRAFEDRWYYQTLHGLEPITPGDGRWVLHCNGRLDPWNNGILWAVARGYISKEHALFARENWNNKLANPARVAVAPTAAAEEQKQSWYRQVMAWGLNTVFGMPPGFDVRLLESNGRGHESFRLTIEDSNQEFMIAIAGQVVTVTGGAGFANANIHATIRSDLIQGDGEGLCGTLNAQALPVVPPAGLLPAGARAEVGYDTRPASNLKAEAESLSAAAKAIDDCRETLKKDGIPLDVRSLCARFAVPVAGDLDGDARPDDEAPQMLSRPGLRLPVEGAAEAWGGLDVVLELAPGDVRRGVGPDGHPWAVEMLAGYGSIAGTVGADGEAVDVYLGPDEYAPIAWVVEQRRQDGSPDERKVLLGFASAEEAVETYAAHVPPWALGPVREVPVAELLAWLRRSGDRAAREEVPHAA